MASGCACKLGTHPACCSSHTSQDDFLQFSQQCVMRSSTASALYMPPGTCPMCLFCVLRQHFLHYLCSEQCTASKDKAVLAAWQVCLLPL